MARRTPRNGRMLKPNQEGVKLTTSKRKIPLSALAVALLAGLVLLGLRVVTTGAAFQQEESATIETQAAATFPDPPGIIDGAKNPELIPDEVAYRMVVLAVAEPADATDEQKERARAKLNGIGFSEDDANAFLILLAEFQTQAQALDRQSAEVLVRAPFPHPASTDYRQLVDLGKQSDQHLNNTVSAFPARLSQNGLLKLQAFLPEAKKGMKIIPDPPMPK